MKINKIIKILFLTILSTFTIFSCKFLSTTKISDSATFTNYETKNKDSTVANSIDEDGNYTSKDEVALYIYTYKKLPNNFITKNQAKKLGWDSSKNLGDVAKGKSLGGDRYNNYEKILPDIKGRKYFECDIDYKGKKRNAKRIVYADDFDINIGCIYYTDDHYKTFEKLY